MTRRGKRESRTYRVMIATNEMESEIIQQTILEQFGSDCKIVVCTEGDSVLETLEKEKADMLFLRILLDDINQLDVLCQIRKMHKHLPICVCSDVCSPDIVSQIIFCGVEGYLSLPLKKSLLKRVLCRFEERIRLCRNSFERNMGEQRKKEILENGFIYSILFGIKHEKQLYSYCDALELPKQGCIINVRCKRNRGDLDKVAGKVRPILHQNASHVVGTKVENRLVYYIGIDKQSMGNSNHRLYKQELKIKLEQELEQIFPQTCLVGVGGAYSVDEIYKSYQETLREENVKSEEYRPFGNRNEKYNNHREYVDKVNKLLDSLKFNKEDSGQIFMDILEWMDYLETDAKINKIIQLLIICCHTAYMDEHNGVQFLDCAQLLQEAEETKELEQWAYRKFEYILYMIQEHQGRNTSAAVKQALDYMERNYNTEISLDEVAKYVGVSPQHFSKIFKLETGTNYVDWITELRMEQAKQYLTEGRRTIKEICYLVGYKDPNYFSRIFKKKFGISPSDYSSVRR